MSAQPNLPYLTTPNHTLPNRASPCHTCRTQPHHAKPHLAEPNPTLPALPRQTLPNQTLPCRTSPAAPRHALPNLTPPCQPCQKITRRGMLQIDHHVQRAILQFQRQNHQDSTYLQSDQRNIDHFCYIELSHLHSIC